MRHLLAVILSLACLWPMALRAQQAATLVADQVLVPAGGTQLIAQGNVEVFFEGTRLSAARIVFDDATDRLLIEGPIFIRMANGDIMTAERAELDPRLENGLLRGARLILQEQIQMAANQIDQVEGRYTQLHQVAATSCHICRSGQDPLWEIRASRVVHDRDEQQIYFDDAQFRVRGVPIFWLPRMRLPDPSLTRATGLLIPQIRTTDLLGFGIKLPYFIRLGDHRDITLTPYLSANTRTLEARYRQAFLRGDIEINAAVTNDTVTNHGRGYAFATGAFRLRDEGKLRFDIETTSDDAYLLDYDYSGKDRLDSAVGYERVTDREMILGELTYFQSLRSDDVTQNLPTLVGEARWEQRRTSRYGGTLTYGAALEAHSRQQLAGADGLGDVLRAEASLGWTGSHITNGGLVIEGAAGAVLDHYSFSSDATATDTSRAQAYLATTLRYPLIRRTRAATHVLEPVAQIAWSDMSGGAVPNEDSIASEFDQTSLFSLSRFAGEDAVETGLRAAFGLSWTRRSNDGWNSRLTFGRVFRDTANAAFTHTSGLDGTYSDWLLAGQLDLPSGLSLDARTLVTDNLSVTRTEARVAWNTDRVDLAAGYIYLPQDASENRPNSVSEWTFDTTYRFNDTWSAGFDARYDVAAESPTQAGIQIGWQNECVSVDFSVSRRFTSSTTVQPTTDFGLSVGLLGFSAGRSGATTAHRCRN